MQNSKRQDVIIELGNQFIRVGLVGDKAPRKTIKSTSYFKNPSTFSTPAFEMMLQEVLYNIFFSYINCSSQGRTVIILEKVFTDRRIIETTCKILMTKLKIERVELALSCVTPLYLTGRYTGLVVSAGASAVEIMPVYDGFPLFQSYKCVCVGTQLLNPIIRDELALLNNEMSLDVIKQISDQQINENIKYPYCRINASGSVTPIAFNNKLKGKWIPNKVNFSIFFGNVENEENNIAFSFLNALDKVPISCLEAVCKNVVLAGGFWRIKGMQKYFKENVAKELVNFKNLQKLKISEKLGFVSWSFNPCEVSWIGCSIGASIRNVEHLSLKKADYQANGFTEKLMSTYFLSG